MVRSSTICMGAAREPGAQQQGEVARLPRALETGNTEAAAELLLDARDVDHLLGLDLLAHHLTVDTTRLDLGLLEQDRHVITHPVGGCPVHDAAATATEANIDLGLPILGVDARGGVGNGLAGDDDLALEQHIAAIALGITLGTRRHRIIGIAAVGEVRRVHHPKLEGGGGTDNLLGAGRVLHPGQLDDNAAQALPLNHRLGHTELVDPISQRGHVLLDRRVAHLALLFLAQRGGQQWLIVLARLGLKTKVKVVGAQRRARRIAGLAVGKGEPHRGALDTGVTVADIGLAQLTTKLVAVAGHGLIQHGLDVDIHEKVHTAAQIQAQIHGPPAQPLKPVGGGRRQVECDGVIPAQREGQLIRCPHLGLGAAEAQQQVVVGQFPPLHADAIRAQLLADPLPYIRRGGSP